MRPVAASFVKISWGNSWASSKWRITGATSRSAKSRARARTSCCSGVREKFMGSRYRRNCRLSFGCTSLSNCADVLAHEADDVLGGGPRREQLLDAQGLEGLDVLLGNDPAPEDRDVVGALLLQEIEDAAEE